MQTRESDRHLQRWLVCLAVFAWLGLVEARAAEGPKELLVLYSFGREFAPFAVVAGSFRTEPASQSPEPIEFHEAALETARLRQGANELPLVDCLQALSVTRQLDLIATLHGPATLFVNRHRAPLFPNVAGIATMDQRRMEESVASNNMTVVALRLNVPDLIEDILQTLPATTNVVVVAGATPIQQYSTTKFRHNLASFTPVEMLVEVLL